MRVTVRGAMMESKSPGQSLDAGVGRLADRWRSLEKLITSPTLQVVPAAGVVMVAYGGRGWGGMADCYHERFGSRVSDSP